MPSEYAKIRLVIDASISHSGMSKVHGIGLDKESENISSWKRSKIQKTDAQN